MGLSYITACIIATRSDIIITCAGPTQNGKYIGWITLGPNDRCRLLLHTDPIYNTPDEAKEAMTKLVADIKESVEKETGGKHPIDHILGEKHGAVVKQILQGVQQLKQQAKESSK